ncbi:hypothetical protein ACKFKG_19095 [Phormidesmis sp. 146-35]
MSYSPPELAAWGAEALHIEAKELHQIDVNLNLRIPHVPTARIDILTGLKPRRFQESLLRSFCFLAPASPLKEFWSYSRSTDYPRQPSGSDGSILTRKYLGVLLTPGLSPLPSPLFLVYRFFFPVAMACKLWC